MVRVWLVVVCIGIGLEGIWFLLAIGLYGLVDAKELLNSLRFLTIFALWIGLVYGAISFHRAPALLPFTALANFIGAVALKNIPWGGTSSEWLHLAYEHSIDVGILIGPYFAFQQRRRQQIEWQHGMQSH
jgi:hypothetical protein